MLRLALRLITICISISCIAGCSEVDLSLRPARATIGYTTSIHSDLISLPKPKSKVVIAVYKFRDQTGQYKTSSQATTFSTAVTQGATSMLNKALEDSGWFTPIEREGLSNLLNERKIITATRMQAESTGGLKLPPLPPLLYAGVLIEGGIIGYDTNFITGGLGARYFGVGGSGQMRKDRITIYLRLISVQNGQVLKSVSTTKTVLSKEVDFGVYRYVSVKRLLEFETGLSTNEPVTVCVLEAIEKAVHDLIIEGIQDGIWALEDPEDINSPLIQNYLEEKSQIEKMVTFDKKGKLMKVEEVQQPQKRDEQAEPELVRPAKAGTTKKSEETEESEPENIEESSQEKEDAETPEPQMIEESESEDTEESKLVDTEESLPETIEEPTQEKAEEISEPVMTEESEAEVIEEPAQEEETEETSEPQTTEDSESESIEESKPGETEESVPEDSEEPSQGEQDSTYEEIGMDS